MKITKTVKYNYKLTEETLEKDIDGFISEANNGDFHMDRHYNSEGLKIIKQYFKMLKEKFDKGEFDECKVCYEKLILFCIDASGANNCNNLFNYEDLLAKITKEFDDYIKNYFVCLVKTCDIDELSERVSKHASHLDIYGFDSDKEILLNSLSKEQLNQLEEKMLEKTIGMDKKNQDKQDIVYFLMDMAEVQENKEKYLRLCERFRGILTEKEFESLKGHYEENKLMAEKIEDKIRELRAKKENLKHA